MPTLTIQKFNRLIKSVNSEIEGTKSQLSKLLDSNGKLTEREATSFNDQIAALEVKLTQGAKPYEESDPLPNGLDEDQLFENVNNAKASLFELKLLVPEGTKIPAVDVPVVPPTSSSTVPIRPLRLEQFTGEFSDWHHFDARFKAVIDEHATFKPSQKLQYLIDSLSSGPKNLIAHLPLNDASYPIARKILNDRYNNPRRQISHRCQQLITLTEVKDLKPQSLRSFMDDFNVHFNALKLTLPEDVSVTDAFFTSFILNKLSAALKLKFEESLSDSVEFPKLDDLTTFLTRLAVTHENTSTSPSCSLQSSALCRAKDREPRPTSLIATNNSTCPCCKEKYHNLILCKRFLSLSPQQRFSIVKSNNQCINCFRNHPTSTCTVLMRCKQCNLRHHTLLHFDNEPQSAEVPPIQFKGSNESLSSESHTALLSACSSKTTVLLATALIRVQTSDNNYRIIRAVLDSASHVSFITTRVLQNLSCSRSKDSILDVSGIGNTVSRTKGSCLLDLTTVAGDVLLPQCNFHILPCISPHLPRVSVCQSMFKLTKKCTLADPSCLNPSPVDALLGADITAALITGQPMSLGAGLPFVFETKLGHVLMGKAPAAEDSGAVSLLTCLTASTNESLSEQLQQFWRIEEPPEWKAPPCEDDLQTEEHFKTSFSRSPAGRYIVRLPFRKDKEISFGDTYTVALRRFQSLERKFNHQPEFRKKYIDFMQEYVQLGHMQPVEDMSQIKYFIPHHGIFKAHGDTSKLRVVFDASCRATDAVSLNDVLMCGERLQSLIPNVITLFRQYPYVFTCDIKQMYRMIEVHPDDQCYQGILWREDPSKPVQAFKLCTVTYGVSAAPFLALRCIKQLVEDHGILYPNASKVLSSNIYVDDIITGAYSLAQAQHLKDELVQLLQMGCFDLRKWSSNTPQLLETIEPAHREPLKTTKDESQQIISVLGILWNPITDTFILRTPEAKTLKVITKRNVLSHIATFYDPCGWITPITLRCKIFMQRLWLQPMSWDEALPKPLLEEFSSLVQSSAIDINYIPRPFPNWNKSLQLHGFCDASEKGYAAVLYLRCEDRTGTQTALVWSRSKVAPLRTICLPRLELLGAHLLANLTANLKQALSELPITSIHLWTDSTIVLAWIATPPYKLKTFVANRVAQILEVSTPAWWRHVPTHLNPADPASRGLDPNAVADHPLWWTGPQFLLEPEALWPCSNNPVEHSDAQLELRPTHVSLITNQETSSLFSNVSSWSKLLVLAANIIKFVNLISKRTRITVTPEHLICRYIQLVCFASELQTLADNKPCVKQLQRLSPFLDKNGLIRVGGRLKNSTLDYSQRHPILIPKKHPLVSILVRYFHVSHLHAGVKLTQAAISHKFWIVSARQTIRTEIFKCIPCFKASAKPEPQLMGNLPPPRVTPSPPFFHTGMDFAGPFHVKPYSLRRAPTVKVYLTVFICFATKAIHLELAKDLSSQAFIEVLQRFMSRRGLPGHLYSDCGTNFVGAERILTKLLKDFFQDETNQNIITNFTSQKGIKFHFNPPASPEQGGLWERAVRSTKQHLTRVLGTHVPTYEQLLTLIIRIEAVLNSRPLTALSSDPNDLEALTPGHFLIGRPLVQVPEQALHDIPDNRLKAFNWHQAMLQRFWRRWRSEYLTMLLPKSKWITSKPNIAVNDLVLINEPNAPPLEWPLGRVIKLFPGNDGVVRVVEIKTARNTLVRPVNKLCRLPCET